MKVVRLLSVLVLHGGAVDLLVREEESPAKKGAPLVTFGAFMRSLMAVVKAVKPKEYGSSSELSLLRGNLALIVANVAARQEDAAAHRLVAAIDLAPVVEVFIQCLRKEVRPLQKKCAYRKQAGNDLNLIDLVKRLPDSSFQRVFCCKIRREGLDDLACLRRYKGERAPGSFDHQTLRSLSSSKAELQGRPCAEELRSRSDGVGTCRAL